MFPKINFVVYLVEIFSLYVQFEIVFFSKFIDNRERIKWMLIIYFKVSNFTCKLVLKEINFQETASKAYVWMYVHIHIHTCAYIHMYVNTYTILNIKICILRYYICTYLKRYVCIPICSESIFFVFGIDRFMNILEEILNKRNGIVFTSNILALCRFNN